MIITKEMAEKARTLSTENIKDYIENAVHNNYPLPASFTMEALQLELMRRGERPFLYYESCDAIQQHWQHNTI